MSVRVNNDNNICAYRAPPKVKHNSFIIHFNSGDILAVSSHSISPCYSTSISLCQLKKSHLHEHRCTTTLMFGRIIYCKSFQFFNWICTAQNIIISNNAVKGDIDCTRSHLLSILPKSNNSSLLFMLITKTVT